jgi:unsaturated rhamnogalacturonyl hydrolase
MHRTAILRAWLFGLALGLGVQTGVAGDQTGRIDSSTAWSRRIAQSFVRRHTGAVTYDSTSPNRKWNYEQGLMLEALRQMFLFSGGEEYFAFVQNNLDQYIDGDGRIKTYVEDEFQLDNIAPGKPLLALYEKTHDPRYRTAIETLRRQLRDQPRTSDGGFWHKRIYPYQMWLDGLYMAEPFYAWYALMFHEPAAFDDIVKQCTLIAAFARDPHTGLFYHGWDERREQPWADKKTGCSPMFWGRALGWYAMAIVDVLDYLPQNHHGRNELIQILRGFADALVLVRDTTTALWYQVPDQPGRAGNYLEASASAMFAYAFAKGANRGYLGREFFTAAQQTFSGITRYLVTIDSAGYVDLHHTCRGAGLGGTPYRDGSYAYYINEPQRTNDMKGLGPFLLAAIELEKGIGQQQPHQEVLH